MRVAHNTVYHIQLFITILFTAQHLDFPLSRSFLNTAPSSILLLPLCCSFLYASSMLLLLLCSFLHAAPSYMLLLLCFSFYAAPSFILLLSSILYAAPHEWNSLERGVRVSEFNVLQKPIKTRLLIQHYSDLY